MTVKLYGYQGSGSAAIEAALQLVGLPFEQVEAATWDPNSALDELRRINPLGQIPTLVFEDGTVMSESAAILIELGLRYPHSGLLPAEPPARAIALRGLIYVAANCYAMIGIIDYPDRVLPGPSGEEHRRLVQRSKARLHNLWDRFADQFPAHPFLGGAAPNALDLLATVVSRWSGARAHLRATRPAWSLVFQRVEQHPTIAPVFERHWPSP